MSFSVVHTNMNSFLGNVSKFNCTQINIFLFFFALFCLFLYSRRRVSGLPEISVLQVFPRYVELHNHAFASLRDLLISDNCCVQWIRVDHPRFLHWSLCRRVQADFVY